MKPIIYIESSVVSYLTSRPSRDVVIAGRQAVTADWWDPAAMPVRSFVRRKN